MNDLYFAFGGDQYYPAGGADDFLGAYETLEGAFTACELAGCDWMHIATLDNNAFTIIASWFEYNVGPGRWWKIGEYPDDKFFKTWQEALKELNG